MKRYRDPPVEKHYLNLLNKSIKDPVLVFVQHYKADNEEDPWEETPGAEQLSTLFSRQTLSASQR